MLNKILDLPEEITKELQKALGARRRTVWDARALLRGEKGRSHTFVMDNGKYGRARFEAIYLDVLHRPKKGYLLLLRDGAGNKRAWPLGSFGRLPKAFSFLKDRRSEWNLPALVERCPKDSCGRVGVGRFCSSCGKLIRRGPAAKNPGEGFRTLQKVLRERRLQDEGGEQCSCGGELHESFSYCIKCGVEV